jgi:predicted Fe-S protein YdhL (DUF1289 family)
MINTSNSYKSDRSEKPLSPCVLICTLDEGQRCVGCGRTLDQVSRWAVMSAAEQWAVVDELAAREKQE